MLTFFCSPFGAFCAPYVRFVVQLFFHYYLLAAEPLTIKAIAGLDYDVKRFAVEPGVTVTIHFVNDDATDIPHNLIFTKPGKRLTVVNASLVMGADAVKELVKEHDGGKGLTSSYVIDNDKPSSTTSNRVMSMNLPVKAFAALTAAR